MTVLTELVIRILLPGGRVVKCNQNRFSGVVVSIGVDYSTLGYDRAGTVRKEHEGQDGEPVRHSSMVSKHMRVALLILLVLLVCCLLLGPLVAPAAEVQGTVSVEELAEPDSLFIDLDGLLVHYKILGQGKPTIVLLHGFAASVFSWRKVMEPLGEVGSVIAFDRPAFGLTERPMPGNWEDENPYTPEAQADLTVRLMDELGVEKAVLVGHSAGGTIALLTALRHPERVEALVLEDAAVYEPSATPDWVRPLLETRCMGRLGPSLVRTMTLWGEAVIRMAWDDPDKVTVELVSSYKKPLQVENWDRALWELVLASHPLGLEERLDEIAVPVLVITGEKDRIVPARNSERLAAGLPRAELVVISNCGHVPHEECPGLFVEAVSGLLAEFAVGPEPTRRGRLSPTLGAVYSP
jgi:pimeloyl-ACP methyl ester carboxylesterase